MNKKLFFISLFILILTSLMSTAQYIPKGFSYQAVAREENGTEMKKKDLRVLISIIPDEPSNNPEYAEIHNVKTDAFGLFNIIIGQGTYASGPVTKFAEINWGTAPRYLKVEIDFGTGYRNMGTTQLLAVPYAMHAGSASNIPEVSDDQKISFNPDTKILSLENGGTANLNPLYQVLSYQKGGMLSLLPGNSISLSDLKEDDDSEPGNELQGLIIDPNHMLRITHDSTQKQVDLSPYLVDNQRLSIIGDTLKIDRGNYVITDNDISNEIQTISRSNDTLYLSKGGGSLKLPVDNVDDADNDPANELQRLQINGSNLSITPGGNTVNIRPNIFAFRAFKGNGGSGIPAGQLVRLEFTDSLDIGNCFNNGVFTVPQGGAGLYFFEITYKFDGNQYLSIYVNGSKKEDVYGSWGTNYTGINNLPFILNLNESNTVEIYSFFTNFGSTQPGIFMGYRIH